MSSSALKAVATGQTQAPARTIFNYLDNPKVQSGIAAVAGKFLQPDRMLRLCVNAVKKTPLLLKCEPQSVLGAMMASAALGLEPNTIQQQAFLIPYKKKKKVGNEWIDTYDCQFQVGARGFVSLAHRSPYIKSIKARAVRQNDLWDYLEGSESYLKYAVLLGKERGDVIGSFSYVELVSGSADACVLPLEELLKIRSKSETYRTLVRNVEQARDNKELARAEQQLAETPWVMWIDDMVAKSAIKKHSKQLPIATGDMLSTAAELDSQSDLNTLDLATLADPEVAMAVVQDGEELPLLENQPTEQIEGLGQEVFGTRERAAAGDGAQAEQGKAAAPAQAQRQTAKRAPAAKPAQAAAQDQRPAAEPAQQGLADGVPTAGDFIDRIEAAVDPESAAALLAQARAGLHADDFAEVDKAHRMAWK